MQSCASFVALVFIRRTISGSHVLKVRKIGRYVKDRGSCFIGGRDKALSSILPRFAQSGAPHYFTLSTSNWTTRMETNYSVSTKQPKVGLSKHQRSILQYFYHHKRKNPHAPCFAPHVDVCNSRRETYFKALDALERLKYIIVDRRAPNYTGWIIKEHPDSPMQEKKPTFT